MLSNIKSVLKYSFQVWTKTLSVTLFVRLRRTIRYNVDMVLNYTVPKNFRLRFPMGIQFFFFFRKVSLGFYRIVNLAPLFLRYFYTILHQNVINFDLTNFCLLLTDATWDRLAYRSELSSNNHAIQKLQNNNLKPSIVFLKSTILDIWHWSECTSVASNCYSFSYLFISFRYYPFRNIIQVDHQGKFRDFDNKSRGGWFPSELTAKILNIK